MVRLLLVTFTLSSLLFATSLTHGQSVCEMTLTRAQEEFDAGRFYAVPNILKECLEKNQNREWERRAYLLLAETYLLLQDADNADKSFLRVLQADPEFTTDESRDPIDLVYLSKKFTATPIFSLYAKLGLNTTPVRQIHNVSLEGVPNNSETYSLRAGWQGSVGLDYHFRERWRISFEFNYMFTSFRHRTRNVLEESTVEFTNSQTWTTLPILLKYTKPTGGLRPYVYGGYSLNYLFRDRASIVINGNEDSPTFDLMAFRTRLNTSLVAGAGLQYKWGLRYLFGDLRYNAGLTNVANPQNRFATGDVVFGWVYADDDFRLDNLAVTFGYVHPFYKARQIKKARTKSVLRSVKRRKHDRK